LSEQRKVSLFAQTSHFDH